MNELEPPQLIDPTIPNRPPNNPPIKPKAVIPPVENRGPKRPADPNYPNLPPERPIADPRIILLGIGIASLFMGKIHWIIPLLGVGCIGCWIYLMFFRKAEK